MDGAAYNQKIENRPLSLAICRATVTLSRAALSSEAGDKENQSWAVAIKAQW